MNKRYAFFQLCPLVHADVTLRQETQGQAG